MSTSTSTRHGRLDPIWELEPVTIIDGEHRCSLCGDTLELGTTAIQDPKTGLLHESCAESVDLLAVHNCDQS